MSCTVDRVKTALIMITRSCLQNLPDNIIFSLKRFEFDLTTLQRSKINDKFNFPNQINMARFTLESLSKPDEEHPLDPFELAGVLVHSGSAETGHYYSYIRLPSHEADGKHRWAEFNDTEVSDFDPSRIPDSCFGGYCVDSITNMEYAKSWNAYMLLYQRVTPAEKVRRASNASLQSGPVQAHLPSEVQSTILQENATLLRRYCLYDPVHIQFTKTFVGNLRNFDSGVCSEDHTLEMEALTTAFEFASAVIARTKEPADFDFMMGTIRKVMGSCGRCLANALTWLTESEQSTLILNTILACRMHSVRQSFAILVLDMMKELRLRDPEHYGIDRGEKSPTNSSDVTMLHRILITVSQILPSMGRFLSSWDDCFGLLAGLAELGRSEVEVMLHAGIWRDCLDLTLLDYTRVVCPQARHQETRQLIGRAKKQPSISMLTKLLYHFLEHLDMSIDPLESEEERLTSFDDETGRWPLLADELDIVVGTKNNHGFLYKIIESSQTCQWHTQPWWPGKVLASVVHNSKFSGYDKSIARMLVGFLDQYYSSHNGFILNSIVAFCETSENYSVVRGVVEAVAKSGETLVTEDFVILRGSMGFVLEPESNGGRSFIKFCEAIAIMKHAACKPSSGLEYPLLPEALHLLTCFSGSVLCFDDFATREQMCQFLDIILFDQYPFDVDVNDSTTNELNSLRCEAVRGVFRNCCEKMSIANHKKVPQSWSKHVLLVMQNCVKWMDKLHTEESEDYSDLLESGDAELLRQYKIADSVAKTWKDDDDAWSVDGGALSEDGYASDETDVEEILAD
jgi:ubiquitin carboxyl-terminal hydrolase 34